MSQGLGASLAYTSLISLFIDGGLCSSLSLSLGSHPDSFTLLLLGTGILRGHPKALTALLEGTQAKSLMGS